MAHRPHPCSLHIRAQAAPRDRSTRMRSTPSDSMPGMGAIFSHYNFPLPLAHCLHTSEDSRITAGAPPLLAFPAPVVFPSSFFVSSLTLPSIRRHKTALSHSPRLLAVTQFPILLHDSLSGILHHIFLLYPVSKGKSRAGCDTRRGSFCLRSLLRSLCAFQPCLLSVLPLLCGSYAACCDALSFFLPLRTAELFHTHPP